MYIIYKKDGEYYVTFTDIDVTLDNTEILPIPKIPGIKYACPQFV